MPATASIWTGTCRRPSSPRHQIPTEFEFAAEHRLAPIGWCGYQTSADRAPTDLGRRRLVRLVEEERLFKDAGLTAVDPSNPMRCRTHWAELSRYDSAQLVRQLFGSPRLRMVLFRKQRISLRLHLQLATVPLRHADAVDSRHLGAHVHHRSWNEHLRLAHRPRVSVLVRTPTRTRTTSGSHDRGRLQRQHAECAAHWLMASLSGTRSESDSQAAANV